MNLASGETAGPRHWVVAADDFAIDAGAIDGIVELIERGRVTATSALVETSLWRSAAKALPADLRASDAALRRADIGLHVNLTEGFSGRPAEFGSLWRLLARSALRWLSRSRVRAALDRQFDAYEDAMGRAPDYVDGHHHIHQFPVVRDELIAILLRRYPDGMPWIRSTKPPQDLRDRKARVIDALGDSSLCAMARRSGIRTSAWMVGVYDFRPDGKSYWDDMHEWIRCGPSGSVLMCHPAREKREGDPIASGRLMEYTELGGDRFHAALAQANIVLTTGSRLFSAASAPVSPAVAAI